MLTQFKVNNMEKLVIVLTPKTLIYTKKKKKTFESFQTSPES